MTKRPSFAVSKQRWYGSTTFVKTEARNRRYRGVGLWRYRYKVRKPELAYPGYVLSKYMARIESAIAITTFLANRHYEKEKTER